MRRRLVPALLLLVGVVGCGDDGDSSTGTLEGLLAGPPTCVTSPADGSCVIGPGDEMELVFTAEDGRVVRTSATIGEHYLVELAPGRYAVTSDHEDIGAIHPRVVTVGGPGSTRADLLWPVKSSSAGLSREPPG